jgi:hypothetical protein
MVFIKPNKIEITKKWVEPIPKVAYNGWLGSGAIEVRSTEESLQLSRC